MDNFQIILIALSGVILPPIILGLRRKLGLGRKKVKVVVVCPHCRADIGLEKLRNYICANCGVATAFFKLGTEEPHPQAGFIACGQCGAEDFKGLKYCRKCAAPLSPET